MTILTISFLSFWTLKVEVYGTISKNILICYLKITKVLQVWNSMRVS